MNVATLANLNEHEKLILKWNSIRSYALWIKTEKLNQTTKSFVISKTLFEVTTATILVQCWTIKSRDIHEKGESGEADDMCEGQTNPPRPKEKAKALRNLLLEATPWGKKSSKRCTDHCRFTSRHLEISDSQTFSLSHSFIAKLYTNNGTVQHWWCEEPTLWYEYVQYLKHFHWF